MSQKYAIHWFRRDLRVLANPGLQEGWNACSGRVIGVFCFDKKFLSRSDFSHHRFHLFLETLSLLREELRQKGTDLLFFDESPQEAYRQLFQRLKNSHITLPSLVTWSRDYEPFARKRDSLMKELFESYSISTKTFRDHLLFEPHEVTKDDGDPYRVYTPFSKMWNKRYTETKGMDRINRLKTNLRKIDDQGTKIFSLPWDPSLLLIQDNLLKEYREKNLKSVTLNEFPEAGFQAALKQIKNFKTKIHDYHQGRDFPVKKATSQISPYLKNGSMTVPLIMAELDLKPYIKKSGGADTYLSELIWREFYYSILWNYPEVEKQSFLPQYRTIKWEDNEEWFELWKEGKTGFPIVDAGMRELKQTGLMHNRVRMIVASFLTKDLHINWQWGEKYFMETLLDGDLAPNNGGWQWAASTGCDPQPYFRIFNPYLQSVKFDPEGIYIRQYLPELSHLEGKDIHDPPPLLRGDYPMPIVDHKVQKDKTLKMYKYEIKRQKEKGMSS